VSNTRGIGVRAAAAMAGRPVAAGVPDWARVTVWLSPYEPLKSPDIPLLWDIATVAVFSLAIYHWAPAVALPAVEVGLAEMPAA
jgi:hypothetical protein